MGNCCACTITTSPQIMPPKRVLPIHTNSITQPLHTVHTGHVSATFSVSIYYARRADIAHRAALRGQHPLCPLLDKPFLHITIIEHCHISGPESRVHLLPVFLASMSPAKLHTLFDMISGECVLMVVNKCTTMLAPHVTTIVAWLLACLKNELGIWLLSCVSLNFLAGVVVSPLALLAEVEVALNGTHRCC